MTPEQARKFIANEAIEATAHAVKAGKPDHAQTLKIVVEVRADIAELAAQSA